MTSIGKIEMSMNQKEIECLNRRLSVSKCYLEYGSGNSTLLACQHKNIGTIDSVESDPDYIKQNLFVKNEVQDAILAGRLWFHCIDIGQISTYGQPLNEAKKEKWPEYSSTVHPGSHDLILVDGRFRVACILYAALHAKSDTLIMVHDFWKRQNYHIVLAFCEEIESVDSMVVLLPKKSFDRAKANELLETHQYIYS